MHRGLASGHRSSAAKSDSISPLLLVPPRTTLTHQLVCLSEHICQEVCPFNRRSVATEEPAFQPRPATRLRLSELARMTEEEFRVAFKGSAVKRAKWRGLRRRSEERRVGKEWRSR